MSSTNPIPFSGRRFQRRFRPNRRPLALHLEPAPWLDLIILVAFFTFTQSRIIRHPGLVVDLPTAAFSAGASMDARVVTVTQEQLVFFDEQRTTLDGLNSLFRQTAHINPETPILIEADQNISYGTLMSLYSKASAAGLRQVILSTRLPPPSPRNP
ncbi:MAG: biopolymer transporter ExbD [Kiritimatiellia bacterium]|nr:biopolymer transporter ExbD [Kiritimatiellia bacterium]